MRFVFSMKIIEVIFCEVFRSEKFLKVNQETTYMTAIVSEMIMSRDHDYDRYMTKTIIMYEHYDGAVEMFTCIHVYMVYVASVTGSSPVHRG